MILTMLRGLPASGKTTWAKEKIRGERPFTIEKQLIKNLPVRVNKDELRSMLFDGIYSSANESLTLTARDAIIRTALRKGRSVIVDDTNFNSFHENELRKIASEEGAEFRVKEFNVLLEECIERDKRRDKPVGEKVIRDMWVKYVKPNLIHETVSVFVGPDPNLPEAVICDIDGTIAEGTGRGPFEWDKVGQDKPRKDVIEAVKAVAKFRQLFFLSGRKEVCFDKTRDWLETYGFKDPWLIMRKNDDNRRDSVVKRELYENYVKPFYRVIAVFDDRPQVIRECWHPLGLQVFDVGNGREF